MSNNVSYLTMMSVVLLTMGFWLCVLKSRSEPDSGDASLFRVVRWIGLAFFFVGLLGVLLENPALIPDVSKLW